MLLFLNTESGVDDVQPGSSEDCYGYIQFNMDRASQAFDDYSAMRRNYVQTTGQAEVVQNSDDENSRSRSSNGSGGQDQLEDDEEDPEATDPIHGADAWLMMAQLAQTAEETEDSNLNTEDGTPTRSETSPQPSPQNQPTSQEKFPWLLEKEKDIGKSPFLCRVPGKNFAPLTARTKLKVDLTDSEAKEVWCMREPNDDVAPLIVPDQHDRYAAELRKRQEILEDACNNEKELNNAKTITMEHRSQRWHEKKEIGDIKILKVATTVPQETPEHQTMVPEFDNQETTTNAEGVSVSEILEEITGNMLNFTGNEEEVLDDQSRAEPQQPGTLQQAALEGDPPEVEDHYEIDVSVSPGPGNGGRFFFDSMKDKVRSYPEMMTNGTIGSTHKVLNYITFERNMEVIEGGEDYPDIHVNVLKVKPHATRKYYLLEGVNIYNPHFRNGSLDKTHAEVKRMSLLFPGILEEWLQEGYNDLVDSTFNRAKISFDKARKMFNGIDHIVRHKHNSFSQEDNQKARFEFVFQFDHLNMNRLRWPYVANESITDCLGICKSSHLFEFSKAFCLQYASPLRHIFSSSTPLQFRTLRPEVKTAIVLCGEMLITYNSPQFWRGSIMSQCRTDHACQLPIEWIRSLTTEELQLTNLRFGMDPMALPAIRNPKVKFRDVTLPTFHSSQTYHSLSVAKEVDDAKMFMDSFSKMHSILHHFCAWNRIPVNEFRLDLGHFKDIDYKTVANLGKKGKLKLIEEFGKILAASYQSTWTMRLNWKLRRKFGRHRNSTSISFTHKIISEGHARAAKNVPNGDFVELCTSDIVPPGSRSISTAYFEPIKELSKSNRSTNKNFMMTNLTWVQVRLVIVKRTQK